METSKFLLPEITLKYKLGTIKKFQVSSPEDSARFFRSVFDEDTLEIQEAFFCLYLNNNGVTIGWIKLSQGGINYSIVDVRLVLATALKCAATSIILAHNHPSGVRTPSAEDIEITKQIKSGGELLNIKMLEHVILTTDGWVSFLEQGLL